MNKLLMKPIEMIAWFNEDEFPIPLRYRLETNDSEKIVVSVDKIIFKEEERLVGNRMIVYRCQSVINNREIVYELKYDIGVCKWYIFKM